MAEPRKITIKLRPVGAKPAAGATKPEPPAGAAATAPAPAETPVPSPTGGPAPAPSVPSPPPAAAPAPQPSAVPPAPEADAPKPSAAEQAKRQTARVELPPEITQQPMSAGGDATIKLKPISQTATPAPEGSNVQAAKSKTARIALDSVLGGIQTNTPLANTTQKTIKLKRSAPSPTAKPTTSAPMASVSDAASEEKTIKLKRPTTLGLKKDAPKPQEPELETLEPLEELEPLAPVALAAPAAESAGAKAFTVIGIVAAVFSVIATIVLCFILQKQAASPDGSPATGNTLHSLPFQSF